MEGGTLSEMYKAAQKLLIRTKDGLARLEVLEFSSSSSSSSMPSSSYNGGGDGDKNYDEVSVLVSTDIAQIQSICSEMDRLWRSIGSQGQRGLPRNNAPPPLLLPPPRRWQETSGEAEILVFQFIQRRAWPLRKGIHQDRRRQVDGTLKRSVTDEDLDELRGCIDLGFGIDFDSDLSESVSSSFRSLADTFPALNLYYAVNREYSDAVSGVRSSSSSGSDSSQVASTPLSIYSPGESPEQVKARLKQWAQVVACSVRQQRSC